MARRADPQETRPGSFRLRRRSAQRISAPLRPQESRAGRRENISGDRRCLLASAEVGGVVLVIDAKNERVAGWYASFGAVPLLDAPLSLLLPLATIEAALKAAGKY
jgi:hypothetical protein